MREKKNNSVSIRKTKPTSKEFGLPSRFNFDEYGNIVKKFESEKDQVNNRALSIYFILVTSATFVVMIMNGYGFFGALLMTLLGGGPFIIMGGMLFMIIFLQKPEPEYMKTYKDKVQAYRSAENQWKYWNFETGAGWWKELRGREFEGALALLLERRGAKVELTKASNDGGVDLKVKIGASEYWIQAKGYKSPVGVAPVREIAGVCSNKHVTPVLAVVNGFTKSAKQTAADLNVTLIDSWQLASIAERDRIEALGQRYY